MAVRQVAYLRAVVSDIPAARISTQRHDAAGRLVAQRDPRLSSAANQTALYSLSGAALLTDSVDAGWRLGLADEAGQVLEQWDGRGSHWQNEYDELRRPIALHEYAMGVDLRTIERLTYADNSTEFAERNQCGSLIRHDDSAGTLWLEQIALNGGLIRQTRRFLPDQADLSANWPATEADRDSLLQPGAGYTSEHRYGPSGEVLEQIDAAGHSRQLSFDRAGQLQRIGLTLKGQASQPLLRAADYNAAGQLLTQTAGNNVTSVASYQPENGRLERLTAITSTRQRLQEISYEYDPVGNIPRFVDHTQTDSYFDNQRVAAESIYTYDSLYQLTSAKGRETAGAGQNPGLPDLHIPSPIDPGRLLNYTEHYEYDAGGNRTSLRHESDKNPFSRLMYVDPQSNRALPWKEGEEAPDFSRHFDANGNLQHLVPGAQPMIWNARNQLQSVINVQRSNGVNDGEWYRYSAAGERVVKFSSRQARAVVHQDVVHYLPGLEVRTADEREELQVVHVQLARGSVRCLHWVNGPPDGIDNDQVRYSIDDHLGSSSLELDQLAAVISHEGYYPYGGTAWWAARSKVDADYKTIRYSGKEQDASGLYYYGARYYAQWLGRWINPDPAGDIDGLNRYTMTGNNPIVYIDLFGNTRTAINKDIHLIWAGEDASKLKPLTDNINNTATQADGYKVHLYLDSAKEDQFANVVEELKIHNFIPLRGSEIFNDFQNSQTATIYNDFRSGNPLNFAHAVDVLRRFIVEKKGGIYSDVDDYYFPGDTEMQLRLGDRSIGADPDELRTLPPVFVPWEAASTSPSAYINNSSFAAHPENKVLKDLATEMVVRYNKVFDLKKYNDNNDFIGAGILRLAPAERFGIMSSMVGPGVLTDVYQRNDNEIGPAISTLIANFNGEKIDQSIIEKTDKKMALGRFIKSGSLASWRKPL